MRRLSILFLPPVVWALRLFEALRRSAYAASPGQGLVEYGLILVLVAIVSIAIVTVMGQTLHDNWYVKLNSALPN